VFLNLSYDWAVLLVQLGIVLGSILILIILLSWFGARFKREVSYQERVQWQSQSAEASMKKLRHLTAKQLRDVGRVFYDTQENIRTRLTNCQLYSELIFNGKAGPRDAHSRLMIDSGSIRHPSYCP